MGTVRHEQHATNSVMSSMDVDEVTRAKEKRKRLQQPWASDRCLEQDSDGKMRGRSSSRSSSRSLRTPGASRGRSRSRSPTGSRSPTDSRRSRERSRSPTRSRRSRERSRSPTRSRRSQRRRGQIVELEEKVEELTRENEIARLRVDQALEQQTKLEATLQRTEKALATAKDQNTEMVHQILASQGKHADGAAATVSLEHEHVYTGMDLEESTGAEATQGAPHSPNTGDDGSGQQTTFAHTDMAEEGTDQGAQPNNKAPSKPADKRERRFAQLEVGFDYLSRQDLQEIFLACTTVEEFCKKAVHRELQGQEGLGPCYTALCATGCTFPENSNFELSESEFEEFFRHGDDISTVQELRGVMAAYVKGTKAAAKRAYYIIATIRRLLWGVATQCYQSRDHQSMDHKSQVVTQTRVVLLIQQRNGVTITNALMEQKKVSKIYRVPQSRPRVFSPLCSVCKGTRNLLTMVVNCDVAEDMNTLETSNNQKNDMYFMYDVWSGKSSAIDSLLFSGKYANELKPWQKVTSLILTSCAFAK